MNNRIRKLRKALDLTQREFADRIGMKSNTIATYEIGRATPSDPAINNICKEFNVNEKWLRFGEGEMFTQSKPFNLNEFMEERGASELEIELIKTYFEMPIKLRQSIVAHFQKHFATSYSPKTTRAMPVQSNYRDLTEDEVHEMIHQHFELERQAEAESSASGFGSSGTATA